MLLNDGRWFYTRVYIHTSVLGPLHNTPQLYSNETLCIHVKSDLCTIYRSILQHTSRRFGFALLCVVGDLFRSGGEVWTSLSGTNCMSCGNSWGTDLKHQTPSLAILSRPTHFQKTAFSLIREVFALSRPHCLQHINYSTDIQWKLPAPHVAAHIFNGNWSFMKCCIHGTCVHHTTYNRANEQLLQNQTPGSRIAQF